VAEGCQSQPLVYLTGEAAELLLECCPERMEDPSRRPPDARAARVFFFTGVSPRR
jgi:hypothetical protein